MSPEIILGTFVIYTVTLFVVAYGMIGASLSGVTFISVPGWVGDTGFSYMVIVIGYVFGYLIITTVLLPLYYRLNLTSIYTYLNQRFGNMAYKTGALFFLLSRIVGASFRMFLVVSVLQAFVMDYFGVPFWVTVLSFLVIIQLYTMKGGIKTIIWTDTLQTTFMLLAVVVSIGMIMQQMGTTFTEMIATVCESDLSNMIVTDVDSKENVIKLFFSGMFITIVMTGLDQDMMQKNLSCRNIGDAQKNMVSLSLILVPVNLLFLFLGAVLYLYAAQKGIVLPDSSDHLFPMISFEHLGVTAGVVFIIGLVSAAYSSADGALTALTTSFSIDILGLDKKYAHDENLLKKKRYWVHLLMSAIIIFAIISFRIINNQAVIAQLFTFAGFTYGPLLGLYAFGMFTKFKVYDRFIPIVAIAAPVISYFFSHYSEQLFNGYQVGFELLIINGALTFLGLFMIRKLNP